MTHIVPMKRSYERRVDGLRPIEIVPDEAPFAEGSALIKLGNTHVLCTATVQEDVPRWMKGRGTGWVTAEYGMLPRSSPERIDREAARGKQGGRTVEIQRMIGRSLRAVVDMKALGERQVVLDCDVIRADGGTRCASITGAYVALDIAFRRMAKSGKLRKNPLTAAVSAVSVGVVNGVPVLDLDYREDSKADADVNVVMTNRGAYVEIQGTAEAAPFSAATLQRLLELASIGTTKLFDAQQQAIAQAVG